MEGSTLLKNECKKALGPYRVLDLTDAKGLLAGKIFADLGADVIKVEPPGGDPARRVGPFYGDDADPEKSLFWMAYNTGKRGITLDIMKEEGRKILRRLVTKADFLIESFPPGCLKGLGMDYSVLEKLNPGLIMASITPFGQTGPRAHWKGPDIIPWAMGGYMWMTGEQGRAPVRISHPPQAYLHASAMAVVGSLMALHYRAVNGKGQHVDVSAQQCPSWMLTNSYAFWDLQKKILARAGILRQFGDYHIKTVWRARDGYVTFMFSGGSIGAKGQRRVVELMDRDGMAEDWLKEIDWNEVGALSTQVDRLEKMTEAFSRYFETKSKDELLDEAIKGGIMLAPVNTVADVFLDPQLQARDYWVDVRHPELSTTIKYPGAPAKMSETPWQIKGRAPHIGEHNSEIFEDELQMSRVELERLKKLKMNEMDDLRPLTGINVLDFSSTVLGPTTTRYLADHGATVVKVESMIHPETLRIASPFVGEEPHLERSGYFATHNASKLSITLNMQKPKARSIVEKLICWADVVIESFAPGVMSRWGLGYDEVKKVKPDIIMASTCLQGQTGPRSPHRGYGQMASAIAGWFELTGWPDGEPVGPYSAYSDFVDWNFLLISILTALDYRRRTGEGQYIDQSQLESALQFLMPAILDYQVNNRVAGRMGNRDPNAAPHGAYRCRGEDRWCAIAVTSEEEWRAFCKVLGEPEWTKENRFQTLAGRKEHEDELDRHIEEWTMGHDTEELMHIMQSAGVSAGAVQNAEDLFNDPQLQHREHFEPLDHSEMGQYHIATSAFKLSRCQNKPTSPAPLFGEHTEMVLKEFLGMSDDEIADLVAEGVLE